jgi:uncharacterized membrane protein YbhN (UPF0104 family)
VRWARPLGGLLVAAGLVALTVFLLTTPGLGALLTGADPGLYALAFLSVSVWLLATGQALLVLLRAGGPVPGLGFRVGFLAGMGLRALVPGGSVSGPPLVAAGVAAATPVDGEECLATAVVAELCSWLGSAVVAGVGLLGLGLGLAVGLQGSPGVPTPLVWGLAGLTVLAGIVLAVGITNPTLVGRPARAGVHLAAAAGRATAGRLSPRLEEALAPDSVDRRLTRLAGTLRTLGRHPRLLAAALAWSTLGWLVHGLALYATVLALGLPASPFVALFVVPVGGVAEGLSVLPGGLGGVESSQALLLALLSGLSVGTAGLAVLLFRLSSYWFRLLVGVACLLYLGVRVPDGRRGSAGPE